MSYFLRLKQKWLMFFNLWDSTHILPLVSYLCFLLCKLSLVECHPKRTILLLQDAINHHFDFMLDLLYYQWCFHHLEPTVVDGHRLWTNSFCGKEQICTLPYLYDYLGRLFATKPTRKRGRKFFFFFSWVGSLSTFV